MAIAQPSIGGVSIPTGLYDRGEYMFYLPDVVVTADGTTVATGTQRASWRYERLTAAQLNYWRSVILVGGRSRSTTFELWVNDDRTATESFTSGIVYAPDWSTVRPLPGGYYGPVEFKFDYLLPIYTEPGAFILGTSTLASSATLVTETYTL